MVFRELAAYLRQNRKPILAELAALCAVFLPLGFLPVALRLRAAAPRLACGVLGLALTAGGWAALLRAVGKSVALPGGPGPFRVALRVLATMGLLAVAGGLCAAIVYDGTLEAVLPVLFPALVFPFFSMGMLCAATIPPHLPCGYFQCCLECVFVLIPQLVALGLITAGGARLGGAAPGAVLNILAWLAAVELFRLIWTRPGVYFPAKRVMEASVHRKKVR